MWVISIHAPHTGRDASTAENLFNHIISIHAPHTGRDLVIQFTADTITISIHAPHTGRDQISTSDLNSRTGFQSTRPIRGATVCVTPPFYNVVFQSTRPIRGATQKQNLNYWNLDISIHAPHTGRDNILIMQYIAPLDISIHAPHTGRDDQGREHYQLSSQFQSTRPIRGATLRYPAMLWWASHFNPRAPYGARLRRLILFPGISTFQSTRPIRGATIAGNSGPILGSISIHAPHTGRDPAKDANRAADKQFQSTRPIRGATR